MEIASTGTGELTAKRMTIVKTKVFTYASVLALTAIYGAHAQTTASARNAAAIEA